MPKTHSNWGGKRKPGPGKKLGKPRKDGGKRNNKTVKLSDEVKAYVDETGTSQVEDLIRESEGFRVWRFQAKRKGKSVTDRETSLSNPADSASYLAAFRAWRLAIEETMDRGQLPEGQSFSDLAYEYGCRLANKSVIDEVGDWFNWDLITAYLERHKKSS